MGKKTELARDRGRKALALLVEEPKWVIEEGRDWEEEIFHALKSRVKGRLVDIEHPTAAFFRIGIESIRAGQPSKTFMEVLDLLREAIVDGHDPLHALSARLPHISRRTIEAAQAQRELVVQFRDFARRYCWRKVGKEVTYNEVLKAFLNMGLFRGMPIDPRTLQRALRAEGMDVDTAAARVRARRGR